MDRFIQLHTRFVNVGKQTPKDKKELGEMVWITVALKPDELEKLKEKKTLSGSDFYDVQIGSDRERKIVWNKDFDSLYSAF